MQSKFLFHSSKDFFDPKELLLLIKEDQHPFWEHIRSCLKTDTKVLLNDYRAIGMPSPELCQSLVEDLNKILLGSPLNSGDRFRAVELTEPNPERLKKLSEEEKPIYLNRLLFDDMYPKSWFVRWQNGDPDALDKWVNDWLWKKCFNDVQVTLIKEGWNLQNVNEKIVEAYSRTIEVLDQKISQGKLKVTEAFYVESDLRDLVGLVRKINPNSHDIGQFLFQQIAPEEQDLYLATRAKLSSLKPLELKELSSLLLDLLNSVLAKENFPGASSMVLPHSQALLENNRCLLDTAFPDDLITPSQRKESVKWGILTETQLRKDEWDPIRWQGQVAFLNRVGDVWYWTSIDALRKEHRSKNRTQQNYKDEDNSEIDSDTESISESKAESNRKDRPEGGKSVDIDINLIRDSTPNIEEELIQGEEQESRLSLSVTGISNCIKKLARISEQIRPDSTQRELVEEIILYIKRSVAACNPKWKRFDEEEQDLPSIEALLKDADLLELTSCFNSQKSRAYLRERLKLKVNINIKDLHSTELEKRVTNLLDKKLSLLNNRLNEIVPFLYRQKKDFKPSK